MGTNFYLYKDVCDHCGRGDKPKHIGKSSGGWVFALHVYPEEGIRDLNDWAPLFQDPKHTIKDEYGKKLTAGEMRAEIILRRWTFDISVKVPYGYDSWEHFHKSNLSEPGPSGLVRAKIDGHRVISHGDGTWDCMVGEFS
jgi:hypothetical protein